MNLQPPSEHLHGLPDADFDALFTRDKPIIFAFHGYPRLIHHLTSVDSRLGPNARFLEPPRQRLESLRDAGVRGALEIYQAHADSLGRIDVERIGTARETAGPWLRARGRAALPSGFQGAIASGDL